MDLNREKWGVADEFSYYERIFSGKGYSIDGILDEKKYSERNPKVLFVLKEVAGYGDVDTFYIKDQVAGWIANGMTKHRKGLSYTLMAELAWSISYFSENGRVLSPEEFRAGRLNVELLTENLMRCAVVNINKGSNNSDDHTKTDFSSDDKQIWKVFVRDSEMLKLQIDALNPDIVIAGGSIIWSCLANPEIGIFREYNLEGQFAKKEIKKVNDKVFFNTYHPSIWRKQRIWPGETAVKLLDAYQQ